MFFYRGNGGIRCLFSQVWRDRTPWVITPHQVRQLVFLQDANRSGLARQPCVISSPSAERFNSDDGNRAEARDLDKISGLR